MPRPPDAPFHVVSGGQSGVDRAALDAALASGVPVGGWCPRGRAAEDGPIPPRYPLRETASAAPERRTRLNVRDSDGTIVLARGHLAGGTRLAAETAHALGRPLLVVDLDRAPDPQAAADWLRAHAVRTLNVAGPRASEAPGVYEQARAYVAALLERPASDGRT